MLYSDYLKDKSHNAIKLNDVEGVPCILTHSKGKDLKNYQIYGNSYQFTISGKNLFDKSISTNADIVNETTITSTSYSVPILKDNDICNILKPNTTYTISCEFECTAIPSEDDGYTYSDGILGFIIYTKVSGYSIINIYIDKQMSVGEVYQFSKTFTTPETFDSNGNYTLIVYRNKYIGPKTIGASMICRKIQIEEGTSSTEYEQYHKPGIPITMTGKNLFDMDTILPQQGWVKQDDGSYYVANNGTVRNKVLWENTEEYTGQLKILFQAKYADDDKRGSYLWVNYTDGTSLVVYYTETVVANTWYYPTSSRTITDSNKIVQNIVWTYGTGSTSTWVKDIIITKDTTVTAYEPYGVLPSLDYPSEVQSVGNLTTKNLFDIDAFLALNDNSTYYSKNENGELVQLKSDYRTDTSLFNYVTLSAGNYIISYSNTEVTKCQTYVNGVSKGNTKNFTLTETSNVGFKFYESAGTVLGHIQIEEGSTATEYEPYHKYDIPITVKGKNLFDKSISTNTSIRNETVNTDNSYSIGILSINKICEILKPNTTYTISCEFECESIPSDVTLSMNLLGFSIYTTVSGYSTASAVIKKQLSVGEIYYYSQTFTTPLKFDSGGNYRFLLYRNAYKDADGNYQFPAIICRNIQIEEGSSSTAYEPYKGSQTTHIYLDEPLRKVGDYADYIDFKNQKVVSKVKEITLNGSENWRLQGINENGIISFLYTLSTESTTSTTNVSALSSHYSYKIVSLSNAIEQGFFIQRGPGATNIYIRMLNEEIADITAFKTLLSENNVTVYYQMATPIEENIPLPALKTFKGTSIMSVDTAVLPSNIKAKYIRT